jgi:DNA modification methylase
MTDSLPGSVVFDPYCGTSASLRACLKLGHSFYGFEKDSRQLKKYEKIVKEFHGEEDKKPKKKKVKNAIREIES